MNGVTLAEAGEADLPERVALRKSLAGGRAARPRPARCRIAGWRMTEWCGRAPKECFFPAPRRPWEFTNSFYFMDMASFDRVA